MRNDLDRLNNMLIHDTGVVKTYIIPISNIINLMVRVSTNGGFDHISVSVKNKSGQIIERCPKWKEMKVIKEMFFKKDEFAFQFHPAEADNVSKHPYCLHIWRNQKGDFPIPPKKFI
jgi:hypothetical protein